MPLSLLTTLTTGISISQAVSCNEQPDISTIHTTRQSLEKQQGGDGECVCAKYKLYVIRERSCSCMHDHPEGF